ncbi:MAG: transketolase family protein [Nanoarchaeota archaeon]
MYNLNNKIKLPTRDGFGKAIVRLGEKNKNIVVLAASVGDSTRAFKFKEKFPERYIEAGIAEQNMIGMAAGLALAGKIPFPTSFATFLPGRCYDQIRQSVCYSNLNIKLVSTHAGLTVGPDGATHQMMEDIAMMRVTPNMTIIVPADELEAEKAIEAVAAMKGPTYVRLGREEIPVFTTKETPFEIGKAITLKKGKDVTIIACGLMVYYSLLAAEALEKEGISVTVINMHTIKPIDKDSIINAAKETKAIVTAEEHQVNGGLGGAVAEVLSQNYPTKLKIIGMEDSFGESGNSKDLLEKYNLTEKRIIKEVKKIIQ